MHGSRHIGLALLVLVGSCNAKPDCSKPVSVETLYAGEIQSLKACVRVGDTRQKVIALLGAPDTEWNIDGIRQLHWLGKPRIEGADFPSFGVDIDKNGLVIKVQANKPDGFWS